MAGARESMAPAPGTGACEGRRPARRVCRSAGTASGVDCLRPRSDARQRGPAACGAAAMRGGTGGRDHEQGGGESLSMCF